jgi:hypothetical protein
LAGGGGASKLSKYAAGKDLARVEEVSARLTR